MTISPPALCAQRAWPAALVTLVPGYPASPRCCEWLVGVEPGFFQRGYARYRFPVIESSTVSLANRTPGPGSDDPRDAVAQKKVVAASVPGAP